MTASNFPKTEKEHDRLYHQLAQNQLFKYVDLDAIAHLIEQCSEQLVSTKTVLLQPESQSSDFYLILEGEVEVRLNSLDQPPHEKLIADQCFSEISLADNGTTNAYAIAMTDCRLFIINDDLLWGMSNSSHGVANNMLYILSHKGRHNSDAAIKKREQLYRWENYALSDSLTGFNNRRWFDTSIDRILNRTVQEKQPLSAILLDVDHFKQYNDQWGHQAGDQALRTLANITREYLRTSDIVIRYASEKFLILLPHTNPEQATLIAERLCHSIAKTPVGEFQDIELPAITASMGISGLARNDTCSSFLERADRSLYQAKQTGRNRVANSNHKTAK